MHKMQKILNLFLLVDKDHQVVYFCMLSPSFKKNSLNEN
jgi:hypothetical protein